MQTQHLTFQDQLLAEMENNGEDIVCRETWVWGKGSINGFINCRPTKFYKQIKDTTVEPRTSICAQNESQKFSTISLQFLLSFLCSLSLYFFSRSLNTRDGTNLFMEKNKLLSLPCYN